MTGWGQGRQSGFLGKHHTPAARAKIAAFQQLRERSHKPRGPLSVETKEKISRALQGVQRTEIQRQGYAERQYAYMRTGRVTKISKVHLAFAEWLVDCGYDVALEVPFVKYRTCAFSVDIYLPDYHLAFEVDGDYWHSLEGRPERDRSRDATLMIVFQLPVVRITESEVKELLRATA